MAFQCYVSAQLALVYILFPSLAFMAAVAQKSKAHKT